MNLFICLLLWTRPCNKLAMTLSRFFFQTQEEARNDKSLINQNTRQSNQLMNGWFRAMCLKDSTWCSWQEPMVCRTCRIHCQCVSGCWYVHRVIVWLMCTLFKESTKFQFPKRHWSENGKARGERREGFLPLLSSRTLISTKREEGNTLYSYSHNCAEP